MFVKLFFIYIWILYALYNYRRNENKTIENDNNIEIEELKK